MPNILRKKALDPIFLLSIWALAVCLVNPIGDFPLNDDFSYARSTFNLAIDGQLRLDPWLSMTLLAQMCWGALFCKLFGSTFTVLRCSVLVLGWLGTVAGYQLCRDLGQGRRTALLLALVLAFNPLSFSLSFTFMTDVPYFAFSMLALLGYNRYFQQERLAWLVLGSAAALAAVFVRQLGLLLPVSFALAWLCRGPLRTKTVLTALALLGLTLALFCGYSSWLQGSQGLPEGYGDFSRLATRFRWDVVKNLPERLGILSAYLGLGLLPLTVWCWPRLKASAFGKQNGAALVAAALAAVCVVVAWHRLPWANIFYNFGLGPKLLKDGVFFVNVRPVAPAWAINLLKISALCSAFAAVFCFAKNAGQRFAEGGRPSPLAIFCGSGIVLYGGFLMLDLHFFDRYFFQLTPFLLPLFLPKETPLPGRGRAVASVVVLLCMATFSVAATHDYIAWNRARWQALDHLTKEMHVTPDRIDGGFEFNGWHRPTPNMHEGGGKSWWWVKDDEFVVSFGPLGGYRQQRAVEYQRWLPPGIDSVLVLRREQGNLEE